MSTSEDMTHGSSTSDEVEEALERMEDSFDDKSMYHEGTAAGEIAKVLQLDKELGLAQDGDKIVLHPVLAMSLPYEARIVAPQELAVIDEKRRSAQNEDTDEPELTDKEKEIAERLEHGWIDFRFDLSDPESGEPYPYHHVLKDKTLSIRVLNDEECDDVEFKCASVRADGTLISVEPPRTKF